MKTFILELMCRIIGIGSASGLIYKDQLLWLIGDNSNFLYEYSMTTANLKRYPLTENPTENITKKLKSDFESIAEDAHHLYIFGSGSTQNRVAMVQIEKSTKVIVKTINLTMLYREMQRIGNISGEDFNIEGAVLNNETWFFFQRGNGQSCRNAVFTVKSKNFKDDFSIHCHSYELPNIEGVPTSFTDAIAVGDTLYFLASAENTQSTYDDGEVMGSVIGSIDIKTMAMGKTLAIGSRQKFEGLALYSDSARQIELLLCEDNDSDLQESGIYKLAITK